MVCLRICKCLGTAPVLPTPSPLAFGPCPRLLRAVCLASGWLPTPPPVGTVKTRTLEGDGGVWRVKTYLRMLACLHVLFQNVFSLRNKGLRVLMTLILEPKPPCLRNVIFPTVCRTLISSIHQAFPGTRCGTYHSQPHSPVPNSPSNSRARTATLLPASLEHSQ